MSLCVCVIYDLSSQDLFLLGYLTPIFMLDLAVLLGVVWKQFGTYLGFELYTLDTIKADNDSTVERGQAVINRWKQGCAHPGSYDKYRELTSALSKLGREDIVERVRLGE